MNTEDTTINYGKQLQIVWKKIWEMEEEIKKLKSEKD